MSVKKLSERMLVLDYLRGFFILVIIADHLWRWPNIFQFVSGRGELWSSAAEGFVIISGLLVGYVRGYKNRKKPMFGVTKKLVARGIMLYIWMIIVSIALVAATWSLTFNGNMAYIPFPENDWSTIVSNIIQLNYAHTLIYFLYLYAIFLVIAPIVVWLLRRGLAWLVALTSIVGWMYGMLNLVEWLQWQILFFLPSIVGYYLDTLLAWFRSLSTRVKHGIQLTFIITTAATITISQVAVLATMPGEYESLVFSREPISFATILISFVWFGGLASMFHYVLPFLKRYLGWLLLTFGERSLTAYILHSIPLVLCQILFQGTMNFWINSLLVIGCILFTWGLLKIPHINKVIPR